MSYLFDLNAGIKKLRGSTVICRVCKQGIVLTDGLTELRHLATHPESKAEAERYIKLLENITEEDARRFAAQELANATPETLAELIKDGVLVKIGKDQ
jgi:hypothetical protein